MLKKKLPAMPAFMTLDEMEKAPAHRASGYEYYAGQSDIAPSGTAGICFDDGSVVMQTYAADNYRLARKFAGVWYELCPIRRDDPEIIALDQHGKIHRPGGGSALKEADERRQRERQEQREAIERKRWERSRERREAQEAEAERRRREWIEMHS